MDWFETVFRPIFDYDYPGNLGYEGEPELDEDSIDWDDEGAYDEEG